MKPNNVNIIDETVDLIALEKIQKYEFFKYDGRVYMKLVNAKIEGSPRYMNCVDISNGEVDYLYDSQLVQQVKKVELYIH